MKLRQIDIKNFRGIEGLSISLDDATVLIGDNNVGKTSILDALQICLSRALNRRFGVFNDYDYHLKSENSQPSDSDPIDITLTFAEGQKGEWPDEISQFIPDAVQVGTDDLLRVILRVTSQHDKALGSFQTAWNFLDPAGNVLTRAGNPKNLAGLQKAAPIFYLAALRDAEEEFKSRSQFWGPFVRKLKIDPELRKTIEDELAELNQKVLDAHEAFDPVRERLKKTGSLVPLGSADPVSIEAIPGKVFDMLSRTQVLLSGKTGARLPIGRHGEGTQSLAVICLFDAFLEAQLKESYSEHSTPILALEEPEAHLHPAAVRAVGKLLCGLRGQKIIATHSGDLVAAVPVASLRRLCRKDGKVVVHQVQPGSLTPEEERKLNHHIWLARGNLLFARFWLLVEGETDALIMRGCSRILGCDLFCDSICCIEYATIGIEKFIKLADQLGIDWMMIADKDKAGNDYANTANRLLNGRLQTNHSRQLPANVIEVFLCLSGYGAVYESNISPQKATIITAAKGTEEYWGQVIKAQNDKGKPEAAASILDQIEAKGAAGVPAFIRDVINDAISRSKASA